MQLPINLDGSHVFRLRQSRLATIVFLVLGMASLARADSGDGATGGQKVPDSRAPVLIRDTVPATAFAMVGDQVTFTAAFGQSPAAVFQWQRISNGVAVDIPKATSPALTLTDLQLADTASYRLKAANAMAPGAVTYTTARSLVVAPVPAAVNNVVTLLAAQTGLGGTTAFTPTWTIPPDSLIAGRSPSSMSGNFSLEPYCGARSVNSLTARGSLTIAAGGGPSATSAYYSTSSPNYVTCGNGTGNDGAGSLVEAGSSLTYALTGAKYGYDLAGITVYGGWADTGRDRQAYTVYFSTVQAPDLFIPLSAVSYNPPRPFDGQSATRVTLRPASGVLARNVAAVKFDFTNPVSKNGFCGYAHIVLSGTGSTSPAAPESPGSAQIPAGADFGSGLGDVDLLGSWIWDSQTSDGQTCQFWRAFDIPADGKVSHARAFVTADNEFVFYLDGLEVGRGDDWRGLFDYDLTPLIGPGRHVLAIKAFNSVADAGMNLGLRIDLTDGRFVEIKSDQSWKIVTGDARNWKEKTRANAAWPPATIVAAVGNRPWDVPFQSINTMRVPLPVKVAFWQQPWFEIIFLTLCGLFLLTIFFLAAQLALHQKERWLLQRERARIAMDIHDDIGSRITQLVLNGEDVQEDLPEDSKVRTRLEEIWDDAREVLSSIDEILWALNPRLDTLRDFANYICDYAHKFLEPSDIACAFDVDPRMQLTAADLPLRRSLVMAIKETLNNIVKHSGATEVRLKIERQYQHLVVEVVDNGRGFDLTALRPGRNGLGNMSRRMRELGGNCHLSSQPGKGCRIEFNIPLKRSRKFAWFKK